MRLILLLVAILSLCGCMTKNVTLYLDINGSHNATVTINDSQQKPLDILREFSGTIPAL